MSKGRILVIDDEPNVRESIRMILKKADYEIVEAEDGAQAIEAIRSGDNPIKVNAVICDLVMPKVNGMEAIAFFRSQFPGIPVLALTGFPNVQNISELYQKGIVDYLVKPITPEQLLAAVEKAVPKHKVFD